jgi:hypothetical protein
MSLGDESVDSFNFYSVFYSKSSYFSKLLFLYMRIHKYIPIAAAPTATGTSTDTTIMVV